MTDFLQVITSDDPAVRNQPLDRLCDNLSADELLSHCETLDEFRRSCPNLYQRVRALFFLYAIYRFHLPQQLVGREVGVIPFGGYEQLLGRRFPEAIDTFLNAQKSAGPTVTLTSAIAEAYHRLAFQTLANQVRRSVRTVKGNQWMFRTGHPADIPLRIRPELLEFNSSERCFPCLRERTSVRMDFTHSAWSDIFFLGMDFPEGAQVINASVDLAVRGRHKSPEPPIDCSLRIIDEPVLRLVSIDLDSKADIHDVNEVFDFARDYLGLLKAAVIAAGLIPPGLEGCGAKIADVFAATIGPGMGLEVVSRVNDIPKGSRLAVSTNLLGSLIAMCMRATGQVSSLTGALTEADRRIVAARAILGEWLGGSGGGWQDSGGVWPGIKLIQGAIATESDPEFGISRGRLMPQHSVFSDADISHETRERLQRSLVLVHGGMAQNVGPILEMVTEKYLLRSEAEWAARKDAISILADITTALADGDIAAVGRATDRNFREPLQTIIPWCSNAYTEELIRRCREKYKAQFHGFWMLGGMSGGGMGFIFDPAVRDEAQAWLQTMMQEVKQSMQDSVPFAMNPVVYDFAINDRGTFCELKRDGDMPVGYRALVVPDLLKADFNTLSPMTRREIERAGDVCRNGGEDSDFAMRMINRILPCSINDTESADTLQSLLKENGFDPVGHEQLREELTSGRLGLAQNRLAATVRIQDVNDDDVTDARAAIENSVVELGHKAISEGRAGVVTLAAGVGSRWTQGAGVVKALNMFCRMNGEFRSFLDIHLAKTRHAAKRFEAVVPHVISTGYLTDPAIRRFVQERYDSDDVRVSKGASVGLRMIPTIRDLQFAWEEMPQQVLDEQQEKMRSSVRAALANWARSSGEASDYTDNLPLQCLHPVGHWYEIPNLLLNGTLQRMLQQHPNLQYLMLHNVDTLGADLDAGCLGLHIASNADLSYEVISRRLDDRGGGLARVDGRVRLVEGLAMPREEDEFKLSYYNTLTTWISIDRLLQIFGLSRDDLADRSKIDAAVRTLGHRIPTYITLKDVKKRWGRGQEDVFPVLQFEKLWGDMTALPDVDCQYLVVPTMRGQQLKDPAQLDGWLRDGSAAYVESLVDWA
ncbi:UTP--glucose-1-phosphate uridylyltransferase [Fuerstiella marisgermanici]|uniref:Bifunctional fucokinase/L-fucose-1-P-guanylyltransferase n=1 Tax=Fuerstiella marisgermanici TaxID=1891926 RepID=A0A1P8WAM4_9PLAN|nr:UTP--glucose-1-phosphate uridylyltransferase [Fuerstiella marisgermanici]APZ91091.1 bifunctional fucokinase/L-fucose-1-P-guanylyltransferase [Fuerstiella marisgermanici]